MGVLISIFGPDGSGKSTQARLLAQQLAKSGHTIDFVWIKSYHTLAYVLSRIIARLSPWTVEKNRVGTIVRLRGIARSNIGRRVWAWLELVSLLPLVLLRVIIPLKLGRIVIADRYVADSIASISYALDDPAFPLRRPARLMLRLIPRNAILIYLHCRPEVVVERRGSTADPQAFLLFQHKVYRQLASALGALEIDTSEKSIEETADIIKGELSLANQIGDRAISLRA